MIFASLLDLFSTKGFPARWYCGNWSEIHGWTHVLSDTAIFGAYAAIPISIGYYAWKRGSLEIPALYWLFGAFIFSCGFGHLIEASIFWHPWYRLSALSKVITAIVSWATVIAVIRYLPVAVTLPGAVKLNAQLQAEVDERKRAESELRESETAWRALAETVPDFIFSTDGKGACDFVNQRFCDYTGLTLEEAQGDGWGRVIHGEDRPKCIEKWAVSVQNSSSFEIEYRIRKYDGTYGWFIGRSRPVKNDAGKVEKWMGCCTDISQLRETNERLSFSEERFRQVVDATPTAILMTDADGKILLVNGQAEKLFGYEREELVGEQVETLVPAAAHSAHRGHRDEFFKNPTTKAMGRGRDLHGVRKDGTEVPIEIGLNPVVTREGPHVLAAISDISERKRLQEERILFERNLQETQKLESLGVLAGGIAHDFNNLLTGIIGNASLAKLDTPDSSPVQDNLRYIEEASLRAADLCKQMLAYAGKGRFVLKPLDISLLVEDILYLLQTSIKKNCVLRQDLRKKLPAIEADPTQIRQVLLNLVINASEAIGDRSGVITLSTGLLNADADYLAEAGIEKQIAPGDYVFVEISDNGSGMDQETRAKIFDPFFTTKFAGRGLGLAAVLGIVRGHGGAMKVYSEQGRGTTFKIFLPAKDLIPEVEQSVADCGASDSSARILVVDDDETVRATAGRILKGAGHEIVFAEHGVRAMELFSEDPAAFDLVLMDLTMPRMDGVATFRELKRIRKNVKVILMSGFNEQDAVNQFTGKGLAKFIQKPFTPNQLGKVVNEVLAHGASGSDDQA